MRGMKEQALTCQTRGKFLKFKRMRMIQRSFQIEEETKVSESTSFPGRVSSESGIAVCWGIQLQRDTCLRFCWMKLSSWVAFCGTRSFVVGGRRSTPSIHIDGQYRSDDTFYTKIGILSTEGAIFWKAMNTGRR